MARPDQHKVNRESAERLGWMTIHKVTDNDRSVSNLGVMRESLEQLSRMLRTGHLPDATAAGGGGSRR
jgi:hypothetical protein